MAGGILMAYLAGVHFWWQDVGRMYPGALQVRCGHHLYRLYPYVSFRSSFSAIWACRAGIMGIRRVAGAQPVSTAGATVLGIGYLLPMIYMTWSLKYGAIAGSNPWRGYWPGVADPAAPANRQTPRDPRRGL
jgi:cytochrome c oxidase subunit I